MSPSLFTVGHSNHTLEHLIGLLTMHDVTCVADVRSQPYSRHNPQFNRETLMAALQVQSIAYEFMGTSLGARTSDPSCVEGGRISYRRLAATKPFQEGLQAVLKAAERRTVALMCAEKDPLTCHRTILVCRHLQRPDLQIQHILQDGQLESHASAEIRLLSMWNHQADLFSDEAELIERAYDQQGDEIAWRVDEEMLRREALR